MAEHHDETARLTHAEHRDLQAAFKRDEWAGEWNSLPTAIERVLAAREWAWTDRLTALADHYERGSLPVPSLHGSLVAARIRSVIPPAYRCDACGDTGRVAWMIEADPTCSQERDEDGMVPCLDCTTPPDVGHRLDGQRCTCGGWEARLGESITRGFDRHLLAVRS